MMIGFDHLALGHKKYPFRKVINLTPAGSLIGCFDTTFGDVVPHLKQVLASGKFAGVRVHLWWSDQHKICPLEVIEKRAPIYEKLARDFPLARFYISHSCEYDESSRAAVQQRIELVERLAPSCIPVQSVFRGPTLPGYIVEHHGDVKVKPGEIVSHDGINCYDIDIESWKEKNKNALIQFFWGYRFNMRELTKPGQKPPPPKDRTAIPSPSYLNSIIRLSEPIGKAPKPAFDAKPIKKPNLFKSHSEDSQGQDSIRENKPCLIIKPKSSAVEIATFDSKIIGKLMHGGSFSGGLNRYYAGAPGGVNLTGEEIGQKALSKSGSEWVWFKIKNVFWGPVNPAFRMPTYR